MTVTCFWLYLFDMNDIYSSGEDPGSKSSVSKISNCLPAMKHGKLVNTGEDSGLCQLSAKK